VAASAPASTTPPCLQPVRTGLLTGRIVLSLCPVTPARRPLARPEGRPSQSSSDPGHSSGPPGAHISDGISGFSGTSSIRLRRLTSWTRMPRSERCPSVVRGTGRSALSRRRSPRQHRGPRVGYGRVGGGSAVAALGIRGGVRSPVPVGVTVRPDPAPVYPRPREADAPAWRPLRPGIHRRAGTVLGHGPRPSGTGDTTHSSEPPSWTGRWSSPRGDRWWRVWSCRDHIDGLTGLRGFGRRGGDEGSLRAS
jgi:hypothetical protein